MFFETLASTYQSTLGHNAEEQHRNPHCRKNLKLLLCVDRQGIFWMNLLHETSFINFFHVCMTRPVVHLASQEIPHVLLNPKGKENLELMSNDARIC
jgi:hypothetical protein